MAPATPTMNIGGSPTWTPWTIKAAVTHALATAYSTRTLASRHVAAQRGHPGPVAAQAPAQVSTAPAFTTEPAMKHVLRRFHASLAHLDARLGGPPLPLPRAPKNHGRSWGQGNGRGGVGLLTGRKPPPPLPPTGGSTIIGKQRNGSKPQPPQNGSSGFSHSWAPVGSMRVIGLLRT